MKRRGGLATWLLGLLDGALIGVPGLVFGIPGIAVVLLVLAISAAVFRSLPLLSGMLVGAGGLWTGLVLRQMMLICGEPVSRSGGSCFAPGLVRFVAFGAGVTLLGAIIGLVALRRSRGSAT